MHRPVTKLLQNCKNVAGNFSHFGLQQLIQGAKKKSFSTCLLPSSTKLFHTCTKVHCSTKDGGDDGQMKKKTRKQKDSLSRDKDEIRSAAEEAAKTLPGDWNRTADDLMARLNTSMEAPAEELEPDTTPTPPAAAKSSLLSTMKVARSFEKNSGQSGSRRKLESDGTGPDRHIMMRKRLARRSETFSSLYSQPRLGIFDAEKIKKEVAVAKDDDSDAKVGLWQAVHSEKVMRSGGGLPRNGFEELAQWTNEGRMWSFPVDNEEDMKEEQQYKFHEHVFLSHHLSDFPTEGPLRRFMDLVVTGLSQNPWVSVPEKVEHIRWYADYFRQKQQLLESSLGEERAQMKEIEMK